MSEGTSTRTTNRRTTPQPSAAPIRTTRLTRSQSREIDDSESENVGRKRRRRGVTSTENEDRNGQSSPKRRKGKGLEPFNSLEEDLSTVPEEPDIMYPELNNNDSGDGNQTAESAQLNQQSHHLQKSPGGFSAFSGTTARNSHSAQEFSDLDLDDMVQGLRELSQSSDEMLKFLIPFDLSEASVKAHIGQLQTKDSRTKKTFNRLVTIFSAHRDLYGSEPYIDHRELLRMLLGKRRIADDDASPWRPDALLQKANLASLAQGLSSRIWQEQDIQFLQELDHKFPGAFTTRFASSDGIQAGSSNLIEDTFQAALQIRTQFAIRTLAHQAADPYFDFDVTLHEVFFQDAESLRGWEISGLQSGELTKERREAIVTRLNQLRGAFVGSSDAVKTATDLIQHTFSPIALTRQVLSWISQRLKELNDQIKANGDELRISEALKEEVDRARMARSAVKNEDASDRDSPQIHLDFEPPSEVSNNKVTRTKMLKLGQFNANSPKSMQALSALKRREKNGKAALAADSSSQPLPYPISEVQVSATAVPADRALDPHANIDGSKIPSSAQDELTDQRAAEPQEDDSWRPQEANDEDDPLPGGAGSQTMGSDLTEVGNKLSKALKQRQAESNKENIADPALQAEPQISGLQKRRIIDHQPGAQREVFNETQELGIDHPVHNIEDDSSDFEQVEVPRRRFQRRRLTPAPVHLSSQTLGPQGSVPHRTRDQNQSDSSRSRLATDSTSGEPSASQPMSQYRIANTMSKERKVLKQRTKPPQTRTAWSEEETNQLLLLIEEHGTSWTRLMAKDNKAGGFLQARDQVALKDKARNIKVDYLRAGRTLPPNFDRIPINKIQISRLKDVGIDYDPETGCRVDAIDINDDDVEDA